MPNYSANDITRLLRAWSDGNREALNELEPLVHAELRHIADSYLRRERDGYELQPTELINEAYGRLIQAEQMNWEGRTHFYGVAASVMRRLLVDRARRRDAEKRSGGLPVTLDASLFANAEKEKVLLALDDALQGLEKLNRRQAQIVEWHFFGGLTFEEIAALLGVSAVTVRREWRVARAWLYREVKSG